MKEERPKLHKEPPLKMVGWEKGTNNNDLKIVMAIIIFEVIAYAILMFIYIQQCGTGG